MSRVFSSYNGEHVNVKSFTKSPVLETICLYIKREREMELSHKYCRYKHKQLHCRVFQNTQRLLRLIQGIIMVGKRHAIFVTDFFPCKDCMHVRSIRSPKLKTDVEKMTSE